MWGARLWQTEQVIVTELLESCCDCAFLLLMMFPISIVERGHKTRSPAGPSVSLLSGEPCSALANSWS